MTTPISDADLTLLRLIHAALRRDMAWLSSALVAGIDGSEMRAFRVRWMSFAEQLHDHHVAEDRLVWPVLERRADGAADAVLREMATEHAAIDPALEEVATHLTVANSEVSPGDRERLAAAVRHLGDLLEAHLTHEEEAAIPLVRRYLTRSDLDHVSAVQRRENGLRGARRFLPWVLDGATDADLRYVIADVPAPMRPLVRRWQRSYTRQLSANPRP